MAKIRTDLDFNLIDGVTRGLERISDGVKGLGASITKVNQAADLLGKGFDRAAELASVFTDGITSAQSFEKAIAAVGVVTGATGDELAALKQAAEDASGAFSAEEAANGLAELARAGLSATESIAALNPALNLAQGQNIGVAESAELLTTTLTQFGLAAEDAGRVADVLAKSADSTATSVTQAGNALSYAAPLARQLGISLEETTAIIGGLANAGFRGERAGTALRNVFSGLLDPTSKFSTALRQAGINTTDFGEIMAELEKRADGGKSVLLALDAEARPAILALAQQGSAALGELNAAMDEAAGTSQRAAETIGNTFSGALDRLGNAFDKARRALAEPIINELTDDFQEFTRRVEAFAKSEQFREIAQQIGDFVDGAAKDFLTFIENVDFDQAAEGAKEFIADLRVLASVAADVGGVLLKVGTVTAEFVKYQYEAAAAVGDFAKSLPGIRLAVDGYTAAIDAATGSTDNLPDSQRRAAESTGLLGRLIDELKTKAKQLADKGLAAYEQATKDLEASIVRITPTLRDYENAITEAARAGDIAAVDALTKKYNELAAKLNQAGDSALSASQKFREADEALKKAIESGNAEEIDKATEAWKRQKAVVDQNEATYKKITQTQTEGAKETTKAVQQVGQAQQQTAKVTEAAADQQTHAMAGVGAQARELANRIIALRQEFAAFGAEAAGEFEKRLDAINNRFRGTGTSMANYIATLEGAAQRLRDLIQVQDDQVKNLESGLNAATLGVGAFGQSAEVTLQRLKQLEAATYDTNGQFRLLSQQRLEALRSQIQQVTSAVQEQANALDQLNRLAAAGDERELAELDYQQRLREIDELAARTGAAGAQAAAEARRAAEREHKQRLAEIRERAAADRQRYDDEDQLDQRNVDNARRRREEPSEAGRSSGSSGARPGQTQKSGDTYNITVNNAQAVGLSETQLADALTTQITKRIERQALLRR